MRDSIIQKLVELTKLDEKLIDSKLEVPPKVELGDFAFPCFLLSKEMKKIPVEIANDLEKQFENENYKVKATGPYLNFFLDRKAEIHSILEKISKKNFDLFLGEGEVCIEYISPNSNKPLHIGHLRNMLLGQLYSKLLEKTGKKVHQICLINDRGVHICKSMLAYQLFGNGAEPDIKGDHFVGNYYVKFSEAAKNDPKLNERANEMLKLWEDGDEETIALWKKMNSWSEKGQQETWSKFGIEFEKIYYESQIYKNGKEIVEQGIEKGIFKIDDGATIADLSEFGLDVAVAIRSNGTSLYLVQDLYLALKKIQDFNCDSSVYVIGNEQDHYMSQLFKILDLYGYDWAQNLYHLSYGMIELTSGKMKSREGNIVETDDLYSDMIDLVRESLESRNGDQTLAEKIAKAAIRFYILKFDNKRNFTFDEKDSLRFDGATGIYLLYSYARINSILDKVDAPYSQDFDAKYLMDNYDLIKKLSDYENIVKTAAEKKKFSSLCQYAFDIAQGLSSLYSEEKIVEMDEKKQAAKIQLLLSIQTILEELFDLLSIEPLKKL